MLDQVRQAVKAIAQREVMPRYLKVAHSRKADGSLFTEADLACQNALVEALQRILPCPVIGEEMSEAEHHASWEAGHDGVWCIDPIDGTSNFVHGIPYFGISVALLRNGVSVLGVVYDPVLDEMFSAETGRGAWLNDSPLPISQHTRSMHHAMAGIEFKRIPRNIALQLAGQPPFSSQRNFGASTLDWCYVAAGRLDIYLHGGQKLWDYAAGSLILQEAGGYFRTLENSDFWNEDPWQRSVIAALDSELYSGWCTWIETARQGEFVTGQPDAASRQGSH